MQTGKVILPGDLQERIPCSRAQNAIDVVVRSGGAAHLPFGDQWQRCQCVPYNLWSLGGVTSAALNYISRLASRKAPPSKPLPAGYLR